MSRVDTHGKATLKRGSSSRRRKALCKRAATVRGPASVAATQARTAARAKGGGGTDLHDRPRVLRRHVVPEPVAAEDEHLVSRLYVAVDHLRAACAHGGLRVCTRGAARVHTGGC
eukprot:2595998-Prymnesium_polylepis.2